MLSVWEKALTGVLTCSGSPAHILKKISSEERRIVIHVSVSDYFQFSHRYQ